MSVRIDRWFAVPPEVFEQGHFAQLSHSAVRLCVFLYWKCDRQSSRQFQVTDKEIEQAAKVSSRSLSSARIQLASIGLLIFQRSPGGAYTYTLCDLKTKSPYPGEPNRPIKYAKPHVNEMDMAKPRLVLARDRVAALPLSDDTDFNFGHNAPREPAIDPMDYSPFGHPQAKFAKHY
jgi:hypothetical protein